MRKQIEYELDNFSSYPMSLSKTGNITVPMKSVCHQCYLDWIGSRVPKPNPYFSELNATTTNSPDLEFTATGLGRNTESRRAQSTKYGKGFCRWFLSKYCGISHFADIGTIMNQQQNATYKRVTVSRATSGDLPDYLCADFVKKKIFLGEAKGLQSKSIAFGSADFQRWQQQFNRLKVTAANGKAISLKGYIVATQLRRRGVSWNSKLFCEDPFTEGEAPNSVDESNLFDIVVLNHYVSVLQKMNLSPEADAILNWYPSERQKIRVAKFELIDSRFNGMQFYGGFYSTDGMDGSSNVTWERFVYDQFHDRDMYALFLDRSLTFFGVVCSTLVSVVNQARTVPNDRTASGIELLPFEGDEIGTDLVSLASDGTVLAHGNAVRFLDFYTI